MVLLLLLLLLVVVVVCMRVWVGRAAAVHLDELEGLLSDLPAALAVGEGHHVAHELLRRDGGVHGVIAILRVDRECVRACVRACVSG